MHRRPRRRPGRRSRVVAAVAGPRRRVPRAGPVGAPRAVMNIKHPCKPKPVCRGIPTAILLQDGWQDFKCAGITLVYTRYIPGLEIADSEKISLVYPSHILFTWKSVEQVYTRYIPGIWKWLSYDRYIPGISLSYDIDGHNPGIYQVYTTKFPSMGVPDVTLVYTGMYPYKQSIATGKS